MIHLYLVDKMIYLSLSNNVILWLADYCLDDLSRTIYKEYMINDNKKII